MCCISIEEIIDELDDFVYWLALEKESESTIMMSADELVGELFEELVKGYQYYQDKNLTKSQMLAVLRRMMDNRISELVYKYFVTHRKEGVGYIPVDDLIIRTDEDGFNKGALSDYHSNLSIRTDVIVKAHLSARQHDPEQLFGSRERVYQTMLRLSPSALNVLSAIIGGNELLQMNLQLAGDRAKFVFKNGGSVRVKPWHVADSLGMDEKEAKEAFKEIKQAYAEVCKEYE